MTMTESRPTTPPFLRSAGRLKADMRGVLLLLVSFLLSIPAAAEVPELRRAWRAMETQNFVLVGDASKRQMTEVGESLEGLRSFLDQMSGTGVQAPVPTYIYVFRDKRSFDPYRLLQPNGEPLDVTGFFSRRQHANYIAIDGSNRDAMLGITQHEYVHFFVSYRLRGIPVWLNEGLAEFYSTFNARDDYANIGQIIPSHLQWLKQNSMIPLLDLFAVDHDSPEYNESERRGVFYSQSWALVHYLFLEREQGRRQLIDFLKLRQTLPDTQAFEQAFKTSPEAMFGKLRKYVRSSRFTYRRGDFSIEDQREHFTLRDLTDSEALARLGELLAVLGRGEEAKSHLQAALALDPEQYRAFVGLGLIEVNPGGDAGVAVDQFTAARRLSPEDRTIIFLQAQARAMRGDPGKPLRQDLVRLVNANPRFVDAWRLLAWSWSGETENLEEATRIFEGAHRMMPEDASYAENLLYYYDVTERSEEAEALMASYFQPRGLTPSRAIRSGGNSSTAAQGQESSGVGVETRWTESSENYDRIRKASELMAEERYVEALEIYEELGAENPDILRFTSKRDELRKAVSHNLFVERYNEAVRLFGLYEWRNAAEVLENLLGEEKITLSDEQHAKAEKLLGQAKREWKKRGASGY